MKIIVFGTAGLIDLECVRQAIADDDIEHITLVIQCPLDKQIISDKLTVIIHTDFLDYTSLLKIFEDHHACIWAMDISQYAVSEAEYIRITHDYTIAAAQALARVNSKIRFVFLSSMGADPTEQSHFLFARVKGKTENDLITQTNLIDVYTIRLAVVLPWNTIDSQSWYERVSMPVMHVMKFVNPSWIITSTSLVRAILCIVKYGHHATLFENQDLKNVLSENNLVE
jgi:hypothetical protein